MKNLIAAALCALVLPTCLFADDEPNFGSDAAETTQESGDFGGGSESSSECGDS